MTQQPEPVLSSSDARDVRVRRRDSREARFIVIAGRWLLVGAPVSVVIARLTRGFWGPDFWTKGPSFHWIPVTAMALAFMWALFLPYLVLPISKAILVDLNDGRLSAPTVLGRRQIDADSVQVEWCLPIPGRIASVLYLLRDEKHAWFLMEDIGVMGFSAASEPPETLIEAARTSPIPRRLWLLGWAASIGWFVCMLAIWTGLGAVVYGLP